MLKKKREDEREKKRHDEKKREDERENEEREMKRKREDERENEERDERKYDCFPKMLQDPQTRQVNEPKMFRKKKSPSDELFLHFSSKVQNLTVFFNYLHDSNSIFRARGINSEWVSGGTVTKGEQVFIFLRVQNMNCRDCLFPDFTLTMGFQRDRIGQITFATQQALHPPFGHNQGTLKYGPFQKQVRAQNLER